MTAARAAAFLLARFSAALVLLVTWAYGVTALSPFAFDMFVKPRLFAWLETFVTWHHLWFLGASLVTAATLAPLLKRGRTDARMGVRIAWWAAVAYLAGMAAASVSLVFDPRLAMLVGGERSAWIVPGALAPLAWLAVIDFLEAWPALSGPSATEVTTQRRVMAACLAAGGWLWLAHTTVLLAQAPSDGGVISWALGRAWALAMDLTIFACLSVALTLAASAADATGRQRVAEYVLCVAALAAGIAEFLRRIVFPPLLLSPEDAAMAAVPAGVVLALMFGGLRLRMRPTANQSRTGLDLLLGFGGGRAVVRLVLLAGVSAGAALMLESAVRIDWAMILRDTVVVVEAWIVFGLMVGATRSQQVHGGWSFRQLVLPPAALLGVLLGLAAAGHAVAGATGDGRAEPQRLIDAYQTTDGLTSPAARARWPATRRSPVLPRSAALEARLSNTTPVPPASAFASLRQRSPRAAASRVPVRHRQPEARLPVGVQRARPLHAPYRPVGGQQPRLPKRLHPVRRHMAVAARPLGRQPGDAAVGHDFPADQPARTAHPRRGLRPGGQRFHGGLAAGSRHAPHIPGPVDPER
ncbi:MAG: hypothetical protein R2712_00640 [Vicinamibacterales bacterium]